MNWDYIIVGAGSAGCALAHRLSANPAIRVLLLEAGPSDRSPYIHVPAALIKAIGNPRYDWCLLAEPDDSRHGKIDLWPAGRTLGGSSSINGMLFVRGARSDYDAWAAAGNPGWSFDELLPYFKRLENSVLGEDRWRGREGPMHVSRLRTRHPLGSIFVEAAEELGFAANADYNGERQEGAAEPQVTQHRGWRWSAARAYLSAAKQRRNLEIRTGLAAQHLTFDGSRCSGVVARAEDGSIHRFELTSGGEVVLSSGSLGSPKLLMLSGIGPGAALQSHGISTRVDRGAVGGNLQEHPNSVVCAQVNQHTYNMDATPWRMMRNAAYWLFTGRGPASSPYPHAVAFLRSDPSEPEPDLQFLFGPFAFSFDERGVIPYLGPAVSIVFNTCRPATRGRLSLRSANAADPIRIEHRLLEHPDDLRRQLAGCKLARRLLEASAFAPYMRGEFLPGPAVQDDAAWIEHIRKTSFLGYHPVGTCRMGSDAEAVVTPRLSVRGVEGVRVVDASIMPNLVSANTNAAAMVIGERAADFILADRRATAAPRDTADDRATSDTHR